MSGPDDYRGGPPGAPWPGPEYWNRPASPGPAGVRPPGPVPAPSGDPASGRVDPAKLFGIVIAVLGILNFVFGFLPYLTASRIGESLSVFAVGPAYVPILLLIAGLLALAAFLPGSERSRLAVAAVSVGGAVGALIALGTTGPLELTTSAQVSKGLGMVLLVIFGIIQAVVAIAAYVVGADVGSRGPQRRESASPAVATIGPAAPAPAPQWYAPAVPGFTPGSPAQGARRDPAAAAWAGPADDRPTGPQQIVDPVPPDEPAGPTVEVPPDGSDPTQR